MKMFGMCINWKVLVGLVAVGAGIVLFAPQLAAAALPILLLALCPLSMLVMMATMNNMPGGERPRVGQDGSCSREEQLAQLKTQHHVLGGQIAALEHDEASQGRAAFRSEGAVEAG